ncbi:hypothetical protein ACVILI_005596 [Mesorhizobium sp. USDA 4775]|jgi:hypothetical protein|nr:hypothetical protein MesoLj131b_26480 [Mesorhizobium sp. 131-2-5]BCH08338.1 hypothetical protein MesoLj131c_25960 [Mesorhizobium sp. 131-3-5]
MGRAMNVMNLNVIPPPSRAATDLNYEADLKVALDPILVELLDRAEAAGWDRRKAAYTVMFLAARNLTDSKGPPGNGSSAG